jgi:hypothetical protein
MGETAGIEPGLWGKLLSEETEKSKPLVVFIYIISAV